MIKDNSQIDKDKAKIYNQILELEGLLLSASEEDKELHHKKLHELRMSLNS